MVIAEIQTNSLKTKQLQFIRAHQQAFDIEPIYPLRLFEDFAIEVAGDCTLEASCKVERDYIAKRTQYQDCGIPEYWIVDPQTQTILILELTNNTYAEVGTFSHNDVLQSPNFSELNLTGDRIFNPTP